jgi:hypothetical protein
VLGAQAVAAKSTSTASGVYAAQEHVIDQMRADYPTVDVDVRWMPCGQENSYFEPDTGTIGLCTEMDVHPGAALFFAAHEMGHAVTGELAGTYDEQAADTVGALAMIRHGYQLELLDAALYHASQKVQGHWPGDPHPSNGYRSWFLTCLEDGSEPGGTPECRVMYTALRDMWDRRLNDAQVKPKK